MAVALRLQRLAEVPEERSAKLHDGVAFPGCELVAEELAGSAC